MQNNKPKQRHVCSCGHSHIVEERQIRLYMGLIKALNAVYKWCLEKNRHEFERKEIKHLFINENDSARFGDLILFGGLVYRPEDKGKKYYGLNMARCAEFFAGNYKIPKHLWKNPVTGELRPGNYVTIKELPKLIHLLDNEGDYVANYGVDN